MTRANIKLSPEQLLKEIEATVNEGDFASKVREYHSYQCSKGLCDDESIDEAKRYISRFKKNKERLTKSNSSKGKPYRELLDFYFFLKREETIDVLNFSTDLPDNLAKIMVKASKKIFEDNN